MNLLACYMNICVFMIMPGIDCLYQMLLCVCRHARVETPLLFPFPCNVSSCLTIKYIIYMYVWLAGEQKGNMDPTLPLFHLQMNNYQGILGFQRNSVSPQHLVLSRQTYLFVWKIFCAFRLLPNSSCLCRLRKETTFVI